MKIHIASFITALFMVSAMSFTCTAANDLTPVKLTCDFKEQPMGLDSSNPVFGWQIKSSGKDVMQSAYRIVVADNPEDITDTKGILWDSGVVASGNSISIPYKGKTLQSGERYYWKVKIWDQSGQESSWSQTAWWHTGLFTEEDWQGAGWIAYETLDSSGVLVPGIHGSGDNLGSKALHRPVVPQFRKPFFIDKDLQSAILTISSPGHYEAYLNGRKAGNSFLAPGWTDFDKTVLYNTYDVTDLLVKGENVMGAFAGNGFYNINRERYRKLVIAYGYPKIIAHLHLKFDDGSSKVIISDESWKVTPSPITYSSIYGGEDYVASLEQKGWMKPGFDDSAWEQVTLTDSPSGKLTSETDFPLQEMEQIDVKQIISLGDTSWLYDFGQNASGIVELKVHGKQGQKIRMYPAELINEDNTVNQDASGGPYFYSYTLSGDSAETWKPRFTYYGFRYVQVSGGVPAGENNPMGLPEIDKITLIHTRNSSPENGSFTSNNDLINRIHTLIDWAIRSNFQSVVTDCPHREKLGWLEQTHLMGQGIHFRYSNYHLYRKLVYDMMDAQTEEGLVPDIAPEYVEFVGGFRDSPEWGIASVLLPYLLWKWYGDEQVMQDAWPMMTRYVEYLQGKSRNHILNYGLGDWFDLGPENPGVSQLTPISLTATASYFQAVTTLADMADFMDKPEKEKLHQWANDIKYAFNEEFFDQEKRVYSTGSQTAMAMPYCMGIIDKPYEDDVFANLTDSIISGNKALTAGDVGFHYLVEALTKGEAAQLMFEMINRDDVPGYGYQLKKGATALTESWAALEIVSNNHLMLGHVMEWFYAGLGGIGQTEQSIAYKEITIRPQIAGDLNQVSTSLHSPYGLIRSEWKTGDSQFQLEVEIPHNTTAQVYLPARDPGSVRIDGLPVEKNRMTASATGKHVQVKLGSGKYTIRTALDRTVSNNID